MVSTGGHRRLDTRVRLGGSLGGPEEHGEEVPEEYQQDGQGVVGGPSVYTAAFLQAEGGSLPAPARLAKRQGAFAIRLASAARGPHAGLIHAATGLGKRLRESLGKAATATARVERSTVS